MFAAAATAARRPGRAARFPGRDQRMVVRQRHAETVLVHQLELQARKRVQRIAHDAQVERPIVQAFDNAIGGGLVQFDVDARVARCSLR